VDLALALDGEVGLHERLIKISRSHQSAVGIVPKGMERIGEDSTSSSTTTGGGKIGGGTEGENVKGTSIDNDEVVGPIGGNAKKNQKRKERRKRMMDTIGGSSGGVDASKEEKGLTEARSSDALMDKASQSQDTNGHQPGVQNEKTSAEPRASATGGGAQTNPSSTPKSNQAMSILAFRPRGVQRQRPVAGRRKKVVSLEKAKDP